LKNEKERKSCILENNFHVELLRPHREKAKRKKKYKTKKEEVKGRKRQSDKPKIKKKKRWVERSKTRKEVKIHLFYTLTPYYQLKSIILLCNHLDVHCPYGRTRRRRDLKEGEL
jgi:hypothetical protein